MDMNQNPELAVYGLWHLGCTLVASWAKLGYSVVGIDPDQQIIRSLKNGKAPLLEPNLNKWIQTYLHKEQLQFSTDPAMAKNASFVFVAYDTPIDDKDRSSLDTIERAIESLIPHLSSSAILILSAQLPVGTSRRIRNQIQKQKPTVEIAYSPENLRLGEALSCYLQPGHIVIGTENSRTFQRLAELFKPMQAEIFSTNLPTAEMIKHGINSYLALSISLANQLADLCDISGADILQVIQVMRKDPRIGPKAYLSPGLGFSGGTLGRDLKVLENLSLISGDIAPLFGHTWEWNHQRYHRVYQILKTSLGTVKKKCIGLLGLTYKPGTSTLRRSLPLRIAKDLSKDGAILRVFDPQADYLESKDFRQYTICQSALEAANGCDALVLLTGWPEFRELDWGKIQKNMRIPLLLDPSNFLEKLALDQRGFRYIGLGRGKNYEKSGRMSKR